MNEQLADVLVSLLTILLSAALVSVRQWLQKRYSAEQMQTAVDISRVAVQATEQIWSKLHPQDREGSVVKLDEALQAARKLAEGHGIKLTDKQWKSLLESAVLELNRAKADLGINTNAVGFGQPAGTADQVADRVIERVQERLNRIGFLP